MPDAPSITTSGITTDDLRGIETFRDLADEDLAWLAERCLEVVLEAGDVFVPAGAPADRMFIYLKGSVQFQGPQSDQLFIIHAGEIGGMLPYSRMTTFTWGSRALTQARIAAFPTSHFDEMLERIPVLESRLIAVMSDRIRLGARLTLQREKLASLGTMAAGLAHELNNPASAARRASQDLDRTLQAFDNHATEMLRWIMFKVPGGGEGFPFEPILDIMTIEGVKLETLTQSDLEDELADWLEDLDAEDPWDSASTLVSVGFTRSNLEAFAERLADEHVVNFVNWLAKDVEMRLLARDLIETTTRISDLVTAMKSYSYMDRASDKERLDLHEGLDATARMLNHKLKKKGLQIVKAYDDLPRVHGFGGELNQVWTNLIDNAIHASPEDGTITIRTTHDGNVACVEILDEGDGIPEEIRDRIFDPFFTTKGVQEGTGLGLNIAHRIITNRHNGAIRVFSEPGQTRFQVRLPLS